MNVLGCKNYEVIQIQNLGFAPKNHLTDISSSHCVLGVCAENCVGAQNWRDIVGQWDKKCQLCHARSILNSPKPAQWPAQKHFKILTSILLEGWSRAPPLSEEDYFSQFLVEAHSLSTWSLPIWSCSFNCFFFLGFTLWDIYSPSLTLSQHPCRLPTQTKVLSPLYIW